MTLASAKPKLNNCPTCKGLVQLVYRNPMQPQQGFKYPTHMNPQTLEQCSGSGQSA